MNIARQKLASFRMFINIFGSMSTRIQSGILSPYRFRFARRNCSVRTAVGQTVGT